MICVLFDSDILLGLSLDHSVSVTYIQVSVDFFDVRIVEVKLQLRLIENVWLAILNKFRTRRFRL